MKFSVEKSVLQDAISTVQKAINAQNTLAVLGNIYIEALDDSVRFSATNLEMAISTSFSAIIESGGKITIPARIFSNYVSFLPETLVTIETDGENILIATHSAKTKMKGISADEFPDIPKLEADFSLEIPSEDLKKAVDHVAFCCSASSARPVLSGALLWIHEGQLKIVGTNSYRLGEETLQVEDLEREHKCIVPARALLEMSRIISKVPRVTLQFSRTQIVFQAGDTELSSRLIEGNFPEYQRIIPISSTGVATLSRSECILAVKRAGIFAKEVDNNTIKIAIENGTVTIDTAETEIGSGNTQLEAKQEGEAGLFSLNAAYFLDALQVISGEKVMLKYSENLSPVKILSEKEEGFVHVIMPLKV